MRETIEFRISEERAKTFLEPGLGTPIGYGVIKVVLPISGLVVRQVWRRRPRSAARRNTAVPWRGRCVSRAGSVESPSREGLMRWLQAGWACSHSL